LGAWLSKNGISTGVHYPVPVHRQPVYKKFAEKNRLKFTDEWSKTVLSIPIFPNLNYHDQDFIINMTIRFYDEKVYQNKELQGEVNSWSKKLI
jgi:dTDP-4-amino-4,6-dideoxygalactose transaminase